LRHAPDIYAGTALSFIASRKNCKRT